MAKWKQWKLAYEDQCKETNRVWERVRRVEKQNVELVQLMRRHQIAQMDSLLSQHSQTEQKCMPWVQQGYPFGGGGGI